MPGGAAGGLVKASAAKHRLPLAGLFISNPSEIGANFLADAGDVALETVVGAGLRVTKESCMEMLLVLGKMFSSWSIGFHEMAVARIAPALCTQRSNIEPPAPRTEQPRTEPGAALAAFFTSARLFDYSCLNPPRPSFPMQVHFDQDFGLFTWHGSALAATMDESWCGPQELATILETQLGLPATISPSSARIAALIPALLARPGAFWSEAAVHDPFGTARRLLRDYDTLRMAGWENLSEPARFAQLADVCQAAPGGLVDRLQCVARALPSRRTRITQITLYEPEADLPALWRTILSLLRAAGTHIATASSLTPRATGDLAWANTATGAPSADGTLQLLSCHGPWEAAEQVAAWLAAGSLDGTVIITPDSILDTALARHALPTLGIAASTSGCSEQLPGLALQLAWQPIDPRIAVEFLSIVPNPLSPRLRWALLAALHRWPAVGNPAWVQAAGEYFAADDGDARRAEKDALNRLFTPTLHRLRDAYPVSELVERVELIAQCLDTADNRHANAIHLCAGLKNAALASGLQTLSEGQLQRLVAMLIQETPGSLLGAQQAGLFRVDHPGAIAQHARRIVWWNFSADAARLPPALHLMHQEREILRAQKVDLPQLRHVAARAARAWRRPLLAATEALLLVTPQYDETGEAAYRHPLWDEIAAGSAPDVRGAVTAKLCVQHPTSPGMQPREARTLRALPRVVQEIRLSSGPLARSGPESPSSLKTLLGCSLQWALHYLADTDDADLPAVETSSLHLGSLAHKLLEDLVRDTRSTPQQAAALAVTAFDTDGPMLVASLFLPGAAPQLQQARSRIQTAVGKFFELRQAHGWRVVGTEVAKERTLGPITLRGHIDVLLESPMAAVDFKWGGRTWHRDALQNNTAVQLAAYSYLLADDETQLPAVAYFVLDGAAMFSSGDAQLPGGQIMRNASVAVTWGAFKGAILHALGELQGGTLRATGNIAAYDRKADIVDNGALRVVPPCKWCSSRTICGKPRGEPT